MNKIYNFSKQEYNFDILVSKLFQNKLNTLHQIKSQNYEIFTEVGKDSNTEFHQKFYKKLKYQISGIFVTKKKKIKAWQSLIHKYENNEYLKGHELLGEAVAKLEKAKQEEGFKFGDLFRTRPAEGKNEIIDETQNASSQKPQENKAEKKVKSNNFGSSKAPTFETIDADILE